MKYKFIAFVAFAAGVWMWCRLTSEHVEPEPREHSTAPADPVALHRTLEPDDARLAPRYSTRNRPSLSSNRVDLDRRPWDPDEELRDVYELRASVIEAFRQFRAETGIPDERAQQLLLLLYDYQENKRLFREAVLEGSELLGKWEFERRLREIAPLRITTGIETHDRIADLLSPDELRAWRRLVIRSNIFWKLGVIPLVKPVSRR